jgi:hypothetical protein
LIRNFPPGWLVTPCTPLLLREDGKVVGDDVLNGEVGCVVVCAVSGEAAATANDSAKARRVQG